jgi:hypothetical protein
MMNKFRNTSKMVKSILEADERARNNDGYLYFKVLDVCGERDGINYISMTIRDFLPYVNSMGVPNSETVRRTRQKIQACFPELAACEKVEAMRMIQEDDYRAFALDRSGMS